MPAHMKELMRSCKVPPAVLQVSGVIFFSEVILHPGTNTSLFIHLLQAEFHPQLCQTELRSVCQEYGVCFQAYSSLGRGGLLNDPVVLEVARNCERSPAQVNALTPPR